MLQFLRPPDPVFHAIVDEALCTAQHFLTDTVCPAQDIQAWHERYPKVARCLPPTEAQRQYAHLLTAHRDPCVWHYTDLQALLLWEALWVFTSTHAALVAYHPHDKTYTKVGPFSLTMIDFQWIESLYFANLDFLEAADFVHLTPELARTLGWSESARRAALGLPATPEDLELQRIDPATTTWHHHALRPLNPTTPISTYPAWLEVTVDA